MSDEPVRRVREGEVLPPERRQVATMADLPPGAPFGIPLLARAKYASQARTFRAYAELRSEQRKLIETETGIIGALREQSATQERYALTLNRHKHLDKLLLADEAVFLAELDAMFEGIKSAAAAKAEANAQAAEAKIDEALERRIRRAELEAEAVEAEARLNALKNPPPPKADPDAGLSPAQIIIREMRLIREGGCELREEILRGVGGEEHLTPEDRYALDKLALSIENQINDLLEGR
jgi:hypothetical protein